MPYFSTRRRAAFIKPAVQPRLYEYIGGIVRSEKGTLYAIGGMPDHVHLLLRYPADRAVSDLMRVIKAKSSLWVHRTIPDARAFAWQAGYSVFSVSKSAEPAVKRYIERQPEHHRNRDYRVELIALLRAHEIDFEERYVLD